MLIQVFLYERFTRVVFELLSFFFQQVITNIEYNSVPFPLRLFLRLRRLLFRQPVQPQFRRLCTEDHLLLQGTDGFSLRQGNDFRIIGIDRSAYEGVHLD